MKEVIFVRHGETTANVGDFTQTPTTPLTELGLKQARVVAQRLADIPVDLLVVSEMYRAKQTAEAIQQTVTAPTVVCAFFNERRKEKRFDNLPWVHPEVSAANTKWWENFGKEGYQQDDAETYYDLLARAQAALAWLIERPEEKILVVAHSLFLKFLVGVAIFGDDLTPTVSRLVWHNFKVDNTGISILIWEDERWKLKVWNDHAHLK